MKWMTISDSQYYLKSSIIPANMKDGFLEYQSALLREKYGRTEFVPNPPKEVPKVFFEPSGGYGMYYMNQPSTHLRIPGW